MSLADRLRSPQLIGAVAALAVHISPISAAVRSEEYVAAIEPLDSAVVVYCPIAR